MNSLLFDPKDRIEDIPYFSYGILTIISISMLFVLYNKSNITMPNLYDNYESCVFLIINKIYAWLMSWFQPIIDKNTIRVTNYSFQPNQLV